MGYLQSTTCIDELDIERGSTVRLLSKPRPPQATDQDVKQSYKYTRCLYAGGMLALCIVGLLLGKYAIFSPPAQEEDQQMLQLATLNVLVVGDWGRKGLYNQSAVAQQMARVGAEMDVEFVISVGDNFYEDGLTGVDDAAFNESFSQIYTADSLQRTWHAVLGNHDYRGDALAQLDPTLRLQDPRWHCQKSFTLTRELACPGNDGSYVDFFFYDTNPFVGKYWNDTKNVYDWRGVEPKEDYLNKQKKFLSTGLASSNATWKVVVGHHPIRTVGQHGNTVELQDEIYPILKEYSVDLYVNGHDHCLEHITESGMHFLTSGGGSKAWRGMDTTADQSGLQFYYDGQGFMSLSISSSLLAFSFYDALGNTLHHAVLSK